MAVIDGQFDKTAKLKDGNTNVVLVGELNGFEDLDVTLHVVVVASNGVVAEEEIRNPELEPDATGKPKWTITAPAKDGRALEAGKAIGYATAVGTGPEGIKSWQWHAAGEFELIS